MRRDTVIRRLAMGGVVVSATVLSYSTLHHRALEIGIPAWSAWFYPILFDTFILAASRTWQNLDLSDSTRKLAKRATIGVIVAAVIAFIIEFAPRGLTAVLGALMIPAVMATALVLTSRAAGDRKRLAEDAAETPAEETSEPEVVLVPVVAPEPVATKPEPGTEHVAVTPPARGPKLAVPTTRLPDFEPTDKREWIKAQLDAGAELTGAMIDRKFGGRNGSRTLKSVRDERAARNGHQVVKV